MPTFPLVIDSISLMEMNIYLLFSSLFSFRFCFSFSSVLQPRCVYLLLPHLCYHFISNKHNKPTKIFFTKLTINQRLWLCTFTLSSFIDIGLCNLYRFFHDIKSITSERTKEKLISFPSFHSFLHYSFEFQTNIFPILHDTCTPTFSYSIYNSI